MTDEIKIVYLVDGATFPTMEEAEARLSLVRRVEAAMEPLESDTTLVSQCIELTGYYQHPPGAVEQAAAAIYEIASELFSHFVKSRMMYPRAAGDGRYRALNAAFFRLACIGLDGREYEQPYYVTHPAEARPVAKREP